LLELSGVKVEKNLIQNHSLSTITGCFKHEIRAVFAKQTGSVVDQITLFR